MPLAMNKLTPKRTARATMAMAPSPTRRPQISDHAARTALSSPVFRRLARTGLFGYWMRAPRRLC